MTKIIIFTDLDGTLLNHQTYSFEKAKPALKRAKQTATPVVFVTSKTFAEVKTLQKKMSLWRKEAFIVESGGAVFVPDKLFNFGLKNFLPKEKVSKKDNFWKIEFGKPYKTVRQVLKKTAKEVNLPIKGIGDMTAEEFAKDSGLPQKDAKNAKKRMYQEGFKILVPKNKQKKAQEKIKKAIKKRSYHLSFGGRYCQIMGAPAKIKAVRILMNLFRKKYRRIKTIGLGDTSADLEFINLCHEGYLIKNPKKIAKIKPSKKIKKIKKTGPSGWNKTVLSCLAKIKN